MIEQLPPEVKKIFAVFAHEKVDSIRLVGGSVRDLLIGKKVHDFDFATKFLPEEVEKILEKNRIKAVPTGKKFGTITAVVGGKNFEITTLREDNETDGRHCAPEFVDDYRLDAARRDFTINALYLDSDGKIHDYFGGADDLKNKKVRFIGDAQERIEEDFLRILRFFRFSCEYASELDSEGLKACIVQKKNLKKLSRERVRAEILKMLVGAKKENLLRIFSVMSEEKIIAELFSSDVDLTALRQLFANEEKFNFIADLRVKIATLFLQKEIDLEKFFQEICATNAEKKFLNFMQKQNLQNLDFKALRRLLAFYAQRDVLDFYLVFLAKNSHSPASNAATKNLQFLREFVPPEFPLNGQDFVTAGLDGAAIGMVIEEIKNIWADRDFIADRDTLLKLIRGS